MLEKKTCLLMCIVAGFSGCAEKPANPPAGSPAVVAGQSSDTGPRLTDEEALGLARQLEAGVLGGKTNTFSDMIDLHAALDSAMAGLDVGDDVRQGFKQGAMTSLGGQGGLAWQVNETVRNGGGFKFLRLQVHDGQPRPVFRLLPPKGE